VSPFFNPSSRANVEQDESTVAPFFQQLLHHSMAKTRINVEIWIAKELKDMH